MYFSFIPGFIFPVSALNNIRRNLTKLLLDNFIFHSVNNPCVCIIFRFKRMIMQLVVIE